jgi:outer membrane receptor protein involved in Fe transport
VFQPDFAKNFEVGIKGTAFQHRVRYSLALYRVNLNDFQFDARSGSDNPATFNGSKARSQGVEVELQAAVSRDLNILVGYSYTDAKTTAQTIIHDYPPYALIPAFGGTGTPEVLYNIPSGARLPGVPYNTANFGIDYTVPVALFGHDSWKLTLHTDGVYRDNATGDIDSTSLFYWTIPSSIIINARATVNFATKLGLDLFVTNITGDHAYSGSANVQQIPNPYALRIVSRPRTIGMTLRYDF